MDTQASKGREQSYGDDEFDIPICYGRGGGEEEEEEGGRLMEYHLFLFGRGQERKRGELRKRLPCWRPVWITPSRKVGMLRFYLSHGLRFYSLIASFFLSLFFVCELYINPLYMREKERDKSIANGLGSELWCWYRADVNKL